MTSIDAAKWAECEAIIKRFEQAWLEGPRPNITAFLSTDQPWTTALLVELVHIDLEFRFKSGESPRIEVYFRDFPELSSDRAVSLGLIAAEYGMRRRNQEVVSADEYCRRFPDYQQDLPGRLLLASADTLMSSESSRSDSVSPAWPEVPGYEIVEQLGRGGMGIVFKARDVSLDRYVALKFLPAEFTRDPDRLERFRSEARTASGLNHPHICTVHALGEHVGHPFIVMEYIDGLTLRALSRRLDIEEAVRLIGQAAQALAAAHAAGVVHRDIKPDNIMTRADGYVKVLDFGLARRIPAFARPTPGDTDPGALLGTVAYMSPEQARGQSANQASDIFSLGIVFYQLVTGHHPFDSATAFAILQAIESVHPIAPARVNPQIPAALNGLIEAMLHKDAALRPTAAELAATLVGASAKRPATQRKSNLLHVRRERETVALRAAFDGAEAGRGSVLCVAGEPGIGKSTLIEDFLADLATPGSSVLIARGHCSERFGSTDAYLPVIDALGDLFRSPSGGSVTRLTKAIAPTWYAQVVPSARTAEGHAPSQPAMLREFGNFLVEASRLGAFVLFIDDVHWADVSTVDLLAHIGRQCCNLRVLVIVTYRPTELLLGPHPFHGVKHELQGKGVCTELSLGFLGRHDIERYLNLAFPNHSFPLDFAEAIHARTEGSPLFMVELLRYLRERGVIANDGGRWALTSELPDLRRHLPETVRGMISRKLERLTEDDRRLLSAAAVQGAEFDSTVIAGALNLDAADVEERLQALDRVHGLVRLEREYEFPDRTLTMRYAFVHFLYQQALDADLSPTRRSMLGASLARILEGHYSAGSAEAAAQLGYLYEVGRDYGRAARHCALAAANAARLYAHREAAEIARRGLRLLATLPDTPERATLEIQLQTLLGLQLQVAYGFASFDATRAYARARELHRSVPGAPPLFPVLWGLWLAAKARSELPLARNLAAELQTLAAQLNDPNLAMQADQALAVTTLCLGETAATLQHMQQGTALYNYERHRTHSFHFGQDPCVACQSFGAVALCLRGQPEAAVELGLEAMQLSHQLSQPSSQALALFFAAMVHQLRRDPVKAHACTEGCAAFASLHGLSFWQAGSSVLGGWALAGCGKAEEGLDRLERGLNDWDATGSVTYKTYLLGLLAEVLIDVGQVERASRVLNDALALVRQTSEGLYEAELHRLRGELLVREANDTVMRSSENEFRQALDLAHSQGAKLLELRAAVSLCRLAKRVDSGLDAKKRLSEIYSTFTEGFETLDLSDARAIMAEEV
jgi:serine/threonine protein kinase/predicted ATPase